MHELTDPHFVTQNTDYVSRWRAFQNDTVKDFDKSANIWEMTKLSEKLGVLFFAPPCILATCWSRQRYDGVDVNTEK